MIIRRSNRSIAALLAAAALGASCADGPLTAPDAPASVLLVKEDQAALNVTGANTVTFGGGTILLSTTGGSGMGRVSFSAAGSTACAVSSEGEVTATAGTGTCAITATKAADFEFNQAKSAPFAVSVGKGTATIALSSLSHTFDGTPKPATVTTTPAGLNVVTVTYDGSATAPSAAGSYTVVAKLSHPDYTASDATGTLVVSTAGQTGLTVTGPSSATFDDAPIQLGTSGGSGTGSVAFSAAGSTACTITTSGVLTITTGTGSCRVTATKAADGNHSAATSPPFTIAVNKASATISLSGLSWTYDGSPKSATATVSPALPGLSVTYDGSSLAPTDAGAYAVVATLSHRDYTAPNVTGTLSIGVANQPTLLVTGPPSATFNSGTVQLGRVGGAGVGIVTWAGTTPAACAVNATSGLVTILTGVGTCIVSVAKAGDRNYHAATSASWSIVLNRASQSISFGALSGRTYGDAAFTVSATAGSGLPVTFDVGTGDQCTIAGSTVTLTGAGGCTVTASQAGDANFYLAAVQTPQSVTIAKRQATATAGSGTMTFGGTMPSLPCVVSSLLPADAGAVTCTTVVPATPTFGAFATTPNIIPAASANYAVQPVNGTLTVTAYQQQGCFASPVHSGATPPSTDGVDKGGTVRIKCHLVDASGRPIEAATGNLIVRDYGTTGLAPGATAFSGTNVFSVHHEHDDDEGEGDREEHYYYFRLSTSPSAFIKGHFYLVTASWNDGSTTTGWIFIEQH